MPAAVSARRLTLSLALLSALGPLAIDTYLPALPAMATDLGTQVERVEMTVSLYMIGAALGQLLGGYLSDRLGRRPVATLGLLLFLFSSLGIAMVETLDQLRLLRLLQALGGGTAVVIAGASVRDFYQGREAARVLNAMGMVMLLAPLLAPALGSLLLTLGGWPLVFLVLAGYALFLVGVVWGAVPHRRPDPAQRRNPFRAWGLILRHRMAMGYILANAFSFAAMFMFVTDSAFLYMEHFGVTEHVFPLLFGANVALMLACNRVNARLLRYHRPSRIMALGLTLQGLAALSLFILSALGLLTLWTTVPLVMIVVGMVALIMPSGMASFLTYFPDDAGAATGLHGALQYLLAGGLGVMLTSLHSGSLVPMTLTMMTACLCAALAFWGLSRGGRDA